MVINGLSEPAEGEGSVAQRSRVSPYIHNVLLAHPGCFTPEQPEISVLAAPFRDVQQCQEQEAGCNPARTLLLWEPSEKCGIWQPGCARNAEIIGVTASEQLHVTIPEGIKKTKRIDNCLSQHYFIFSSRRIAEATLESRMLEKERRQKNTI